MVPIYKIHRFTTPIIFLIFTLTSTAQAQTPIVSTRPLEIKGAATLGVARMVETSEKNVKDAAILSNGPKGAILTTKPYDPQVMGVVSRDAGIILNSDGIQNGVPIISSGTVYIQVSTQNGQIKKDDLLTTSTIPGVAVKADKDGYVLGSAMEDYSNPDPKKTGVIAAELNLHYFNSKPTLLGSLTDILKFALLPSRDTPAPIFKYIVAAIVVIASFALGFTSFGRTAAKGVEALGRNPSASKIIHLGILFNVGIVIIIVLTGMTVAFLILRL
jgi:F0F1-type ATP synthase membrane subunit c/vacuolar-type H+-ATPase subunit K